MIRALVVVMFLSYGVIIGVPSVRQEDHRLLAADLAAAMKVGETQDRMMVDQLVRQLEMEGVPSEKREKARGAARRIVKWMHEHTALNEALDTYVDDYAKGFTTDEIKELIAFHRSPLGRKMLEKQPEVYAHYSEQCDVLMRPTMEEYTRRIREAKEKLMQGKPDELPAAGKSAACAELIEVLVKAIEKYAYDYCIYPSSGNAQLVEVLQRTGPHAVPYYTFPPDLLNENGKVLDPWGRPLVYYNNSHIPTPVGWAPHGKWFDLYSFGPDGKDDQGAGDDISSWTLTEHKK